MFKVNMSVKIKLFIFRLLVNSGGSEFKSSIADDFLYVPLWHFSLLRCCLTIAEITREIIS